MKLDELAEIVKENTKRLDAHLEEIKKNGTNISNNHQKIQQNSYALDILKDYKSETKRWFLISLLSMFLVLVEFIYIILK